MNKNKIKKIVENALSENRKTGEKAGGSKHLSNVSITKLDISKPKETEYKGKKAYSVDVSVETFTESEFYAAEEGVAPPDYLIGKFKDRIIIDENLNVLSYEKNVK